MACVATSPLQLTQPTQSIPRFGKFTRALCFLGAAALLTLRPAGAMAQKADTTLWTAGGQINATLRSGNTIYVGGAFTTMHRITGGGAILDIPTGFPTTRFPRISGGSASVYAVASDGGGGWFIGGSFTMVGSVSRLNLAHILSDGTISAWSPNANGDVNALVVSGSTVYVGGAFSSVGGQNRS